MQHESITGKQVATSTAASLVVTCEHGGNRVPVSYRHLFRSCRSLLESHRGFDPGALIMARALSRKFDAPLLTSTTSRLLVDLNRSIGHRNLHMDTIAKLPATARQEIVDRHYQPYRTEAARLVREGVSSQGRVIHISCHSFTDRLDGVERHADIGLLYDPARQGESDLCAGWKSALKASAPGLVVRRNFPYQGRNDGLTSTLRKKFPPDTYIGIELELNQRNLAPPPRQWKTLRESVATSLETALMKFLQ
jgi:predicted N-formylglutamate amidohydrolase